MSKNDLARELMIEELRKENGKFVTTRIIDRLMLFYTPLFDRELLSRIAELVNQEYRSNPPLQFVAAVNQ